MAQYVAKRLMFQNGERHSIVQEVGGLPVHEVTLYLKRYRLRGRKPNTIHRVCRYLALLYRLLRNAGILLLERFSEGKFLTLPELERIAGELQFKVDDLDAQPAESRKPNVISIAKIGPRMKKVVDTPTPVNVATQATRIRYIADFLDFFAKYVGAMLGGQKQQRLKADAAAGLSAFRENIPSVPNRSMLGARVGLSVEEQNRLLSVVDPESPQNPWKSEYVRRRNWLIVVVLLAAGMRQGELLGLQIGDLSKTAPKLLIIRRADAKEDARKDQPATKTTDRQVELAPSIMRALWSYVNVERYRIAAARNIPQIFVSIKGEAISSSSIEKIFLELRGACPGLPVTLTSHVMRHTWNERFSEEADAMGLSDVAEERARNSQQGWSDNSKTAATYTRRRTAKKGREVALKLQERLDAYVAGTD